MIESMTQKAELCNLRFFSEFIRTFLRKANFSEFAIFDVLLSSEEILVNIARYAYIGAIGNVEVICDFEEKANKITITFIDSGIYLDVLAAEKPIIISIHLVKTLMDEVLYSRKDNKNILTIIKSR